jgi:hypothetical protein
MLLVLALTWSGLTTWVTQLGIFVAALTTSAVALIALVNKTGLSRPIKWLWKRLVGEPHTEYLKRVFDEQLEPIKAELRTNGGSSLRDAVNRIEANQATLKGDVDKLKAEKRFRA